MNSNLLKGNKVKQKPISSILSVQRLNVYEFQISYREQKVTKYRTLRPDDCSEILAKLKFLLQGQNLSKNQRRA